MQTFITDFSMTQSAKNLDNERLGMQRVEALQIFSCLLIKETRWKNHPAVKMWKGFEGFLLKIYLPAILIEWKIERGFNSEKILSKWKSLFVRFYTLPENNPDWLTKEFIEAHRSNLIRKKPSHYRPLFPDTVEGLEYIWPV
jgi:hypothetical protein